MVLQRCLAAGWFLLGVIGIVACAAGLYFAASGKRVVLTANAAAFAELRQFVDLAEGRIEQARRRVDSAKLTATSIEQALKGWTRRETSRLLANRGEIVERTQSLATTMEQAEEWIVFAEAIAKYLRDGAARWRVRTNVADVLEHLAADLAELRVQASDVQQQVADFRGRIAQLNDEQTVAERVRQALELSLRIIATLTNLDHRLEKLRTDLTAAHPQLAHAELTLQTWLRRAWLLVIAIICWIAAGQAALAYYGFRGCRRRENHARESPST
jgi:chromosome segregation ATPase